MARMKPAFAQRVPGKFFQIFAVRRDPVGFDNLGEFFAQSVHDFAAIFAVKIYFNLYRNRRGVSTGETSMECKN
jgi:hypothetical protein